MKTFTTALLTLAFVASFSSFATDDPVSENAGEPLYGDLSLDLKMIFMGRNRGALPGRNDEHASSTAFTLGYRSQSFNGFSLGMDYVLSWANYGGGSRDTGVSPEHSLGIGRFDIVNQGYINYNFASRGLDKTYLRYGRQVLDLNFVRSYNIRQKDQAFEGIVLHTEDITDWNLTLGHLDKFSGWSSRDFYGDRTETHFVDIGLAAGAPYKTNGFDFVEGTYTGFEQATLSFYDYYGDDLYNSLGVLFDYRLQLGGWDQTIKTRYLTQTDVGSNPNNVDAQTLQLGVMLSHGDFSVEVGGLKVFGDQVENDIQAPFQPNLIVKEPMFETDMGLTAGAFNLYLESSYRWDNNSLYLLYLHGDAERAAIGNSELDVIFGHDFNESLYMKFKFAYSRLNRATPGLSDPWVSDYRVFFGYRF